MTAGPFFGDNNTVIMILLLMMMMIKMIMKMMMMMIIMLQAGDIRVSYTYAGLSGESVLGKPEVVSKRSVK